MSDLDEGFHALHYQVIDSKGEASPARASFFFRLQPTKEEFTDYTFNSVRYWFDKDYTPHESTYVNGTSVIDVSDLDEGFHALHYQVIDSKGEASPSRTSLFFHMQSTKEDFADYTVLTIQYWFDEDITAVHEVTYNGGTITLDMTDLPEGPHTLHYQVKTDESQVSPARSVEFERCITKDEEDAVIEVPSAATNTKESYDFSGRRVGDKTKGLVIRMSDGTSKKILIK